jgi:hypothetical protein
MTHPELSGGILMVRGALLIMGRSWGRRMEPW